MNAVYRLNSVSSCKDIGITKCWVCFNAFFTKHKKRNQSVTDLIGMQLNFKSFANTPFLDDFLTLVDHSSRDDHRTNLS